MQNALRLGKVYNAIKNLPDHPSKHIYWIVYNSDMIEYTTNLIRELKGAAYLTNVSVVSKGDPSRKRSTGATYFDPGLFELLGNGSL